MEILVILMRILVRIPVRIPVRILERILVMPMNFWVILSISVLGIPRNSVAPVAVSWSTCMCLVVGDRSECFEVDRPVRAGRDTTS